MVLRMLLDESYPSIQLTTARKAGDLLTVTCLRQSIPSRGPHIAAPPVASLIPCCGACMRMLALSLEFDPVGVGIKDTHPGKNTRLTHSNRPSKTTPSTRLPTMSFFSTGSNGSYSIFLSSSTILG